MHPSCVRGSIPDSISPAMLHERVVSYAERRGSAMRIFALISLRIAQRWISACRRRHRVLVRQSLRQPERARSAVHSNAACFKASRSRKDVELESFHIRENRCKVEPHAKH